MIETAPAALTLIVPVYNERRRFDRFASDLAEFTAHQPAGSELVFVDDGSTDGTVELIEMFLRRAALRGHCVRLLRCAHMGKGAAVRAGLETAVTPLAGFCDLDLSTPLADFLHLVDASADAPILTIASRGLAASRLTRRQGHAREFLGRTFNKAVQLALIPGVVDTQCGAKVARTELWRAILPFSRENGFAWDVEIIAIAMRLGISVQEVAVEWRHEDESKMRVARDGAAMLRALVRIRRGLPMQLPEDADTRDLKAPEHIAAPMARPSQANGDAVDPRAAVIASADGAHWWFRSKAAFVDFALKQCAQSEGRLVDLGGGAGDVTAKLGWQPDRTIVADATEKLAYEAHRRHALEVVCSELDQVPLVDGVANVVCALDVLQCLPHPVPMLREARRLLGPDGRMIVIVPGHPRLWSASDEALNHMRRYTRQALRTELEAAGFEVLFCSHIFSWLVIPVWVQRRRHQGDPKLGLDVESTLVDRCALLLARLELALLRRVTLPAGTSVLCISKARQ